MGKLKANNIKEMWANYLLETNDPRYGELPRKRQADGKEKILLGLIKLQDMDRSFLSDNNIQNSLSQYKGRNGDSIKKLNEIAKQNDAGSEDTVLKQQHTKSIVAARMLRECKPTSDIMDYLVSTYNCEERQAKYAIEKGRLINKEYYKDMLPTIKSDLWNMYSDLLNQARASKNIKEARNILDSISKLTGANEPEQVNNSGEIIIKFD